jgi:hypothetical protein
MRHELYSYITKTFTLCTGSYIRKDIEIESNIAKSKDIDSNIVKTFEVLSQIDREAGIV